MRKVVVRSVPAKVEDSQRLLELLSIGLQRLLSGEPVPNDSTPTVDFLPDVSGTSFTNGTVSEGDD